jgi:hypothetical protein
MGTKYDSVNQLTIMLISILVILRRCLVSENPALMKWRMRWLRPRLSNTDSIGGSLSRLTLELGPEEEGDAFLAAGLLASLDRAALSVCFFALKKRDFLFDSCALDAVGAAFTPRWK